MLIQETPAEVGGGVWMLGTTAYPMYLLRGDREGAIIEGGISALGPLLDRQFRGLGVGPTYVRQAVITHAHPDHVMAVPFLRERFPGITVLASPAAAATLTKEKAVAFFRKIDAALADALHQSGAIADSPVPPALAENRIAVDRIVREGDVMAVDGRSWTVLETSGHSDCSISLHDAGHGVLAVADATGFYVPAAGAWWPMYFSDYAAYVRSLDRLAALDAEIVCLSHNCAIRGRQEVRAYFAGAIAAVRQYHDQIVAAAKAGRPTSEIAAELAVEAHRRAPVLPVDFFQKNCDLLVKQSLRHEGLEPAHLSSSRR